MKGCDNIALVNILDLIPQFNPFLFAAILIWSLFWKTLALWRCVKGSQRYWFLAILVLNTLGILEIIYLFKFSKNKLTLKDIKNKNFLPN